MTIGIIIVFSNIEPVINKNLIIKNLHKATDIQFCLVNNQSKDNTYYLLKDIKEACENVSIVNIKKIRSSKAAIRAGARYMSSQFSLRHLGYLNTKKLNLDENGFTVLLKNIIENQDAMINYNIEIIKQQRIKQTLFQSLFSVIDYLKKSSQI